MATEAKFSHIDGLAYGRVRFVGFIKHGSNPRAVHVDVDAEEVLRLANAIRGCHRVYEDPRTGEYPRDLEDARHSRFAISQVSHAVWHMNHPESSMPCRPEGEKVIDVESPLAVRGPCRACRGKGKISRRQDPGCHRCGGSGVEPPP